MPFSKAQRRSHRKVQTHDHRHREQRSHHSTTLSIKQEILRRTVLEYVRMQIDIPGAVLRRVSTVDERLPTPLPRLPGHVEQWFSPTLGKSIRTLLIVRKLFYSSFT